jgi:putative hydrolase of the HAD superfamily
MVKVVVFDCDGMMIKLRGYFSERLAGELEIPLQTIKVFFDREFRQCLTGKADLKESIEPYLASWGWSKSVDALLKFWFESEKNVDSQMVAAIKQLKSQGIACFLATNQEKYRTLYLADKLGFLHLFDLMVVSFEIGAVKPQPEFYTKLYEALEMFTDVTDPTEVMVWDDKPVNILAANNFGFNAFHFQNYPAFLNDLKRHSLLI